MEAAGTFQRLRHVPHRSAQPRPFVAALSPHDGRTLALWSEDGPIELLDLVGGQPRPVGRDEGGAWSIQFSPDGTTLVTGGAGTVKIWDVASGQLRETFQGHEARVADLRFSPDGRTLYSAGSKSVIAWDLEGSSRLGRPLSLFTGRFPYSPTLTSPHALAVSPDGTLLAEPVPTAPDHPTLLDLHDPRQARQLPAPGVGQISAMAFSRDGRRLAVAGSAPAPVLIDVASGKVQVRMTGGGHRDGVNSVGFDPRANGWQPAASTTCKPSSGASKPAGRSTASAIPPPTNRNRSRYGGARTAPPWPRGAGRARSSSGEPPTGGRSPPCRPIPAGS